MNQYTKLFIDGSEVDLYTAETLPLSITKHVNNLDGEVQGDFSRASVTIPATKKNKNILGLSRRFMPFRIEVDGSPAFSGTAAVRKGKTQGSGYEAIEDNFDINLISNNSNWFVFLGETLLSECTDIVEPWDVTRVSFGWSGGGDYAFMLIKWREWEYWTGSYYGIKYQESTPGLFIVPLIRNAFALIGYTVESDFLDNVDIKKLILPTPIPKKSSAAFGDKYLNTRVSMSAPVTLPAFGNIPYDVIDVAAPQNPTAWNTTLYEYTAPLAGYYKCEVVMQFSTTVPPGYLFVAALAINAFSFTPQTGVFLNSAILNYPIGGVPVRFEGIIFAQAGDIIKVQHQEISGNPITVDSSTLTITGEATKEWGMLLDFKFLLRDWKFLDMLKGLKTIFNLGFETDDVSKTVRIEPLDRYRNKSKYISNANPTSFTETKEGFYQDSVIKDYSKLVDYEKEGSFEFEDIEGTFEFKWQNADDETADWVEGNNNLKIYESRYSMSSGADQSKKREIEVPFFAKTIHVSDIEAKYPNTNIVPQFPLIYPKNYVLDPTATEADVDYETQPRLLYHAGRRPFLTDDEFDGLFELYDDNTLIGPSYVPATFMVNYNDKTGLDPSLSFANEVLNDVTVEGLLQNYHLQSTLRHDKGQLRENYIRFNSIDNNNFSFQSEGNY